MFLIEITCSSKDGKDTLPMIQVPTRASMIKGSLKGEVKGKKPSFLIPFGSSTSQWSDLRELANKRRSGKFFKTLFYTLRWWLFPLLFTAVCWTVLLSPQLLPTAPIVFRSRKEVGER